MMYYEKLDCNCSFMKEWKKQPKQPRRALPVEELQSCCVMKRRKDNPRNPIVKRPSYIFCMIFQQRPKEQAEEKKKQAKKQNKPKRRKDQRTTERNCVRKLRSLRGRKKIQKKTKKERTGSDEGFKTADELLADGTTKLQNTALSSSSTGMESQDVKVAFLMIEIKTKQK